MYNPEHSPRTPEQVAEQGYSVETTLLHGLEAAKAEKDIQGYLDQRPYTDQNGSIHDPSDSTLIDPEAYHDQQRLARQESTTKDYADMTQSELALKAAQSIFNGDKTTETNVYDEIFNRIEQFEATPQKEGKERDLAEEYDTLINSRYERMMQKNSDQETVKPVPGPAQGAAEAVKEPEDTEQESKVTAEAPEPSSTEADSAKETAALEAAEADAKAAEALAKAEAEAVREAAVREASEALAEAQAIRHQAHQEAQEAKEAAALEAQSIVDSAQEQASQIRDSIQSELDRQANGVEIDGVTYRKKALGNDEQYLDPNSAEYVWAPDASTVDEPLNMMIEWEPTVQEIDGKKYMKVPARAYSGKNEPWNSYELRARQYPDEFIFVEVPADGMKFPSGKLGSPLKGTIFERRNKTNNNDVQRDQKTREFTHIKAIRSKIGQVSVGRGVLAKTKARVANTANRTKDAQRIDRKTYELINTVNDYDFLTQYNSLNQYDKAKVQEEFKILNHDYSNTAKDKERTFNTIFTDANGNIDQDSKTNAYNERAHIENLVKRELLDADKSYVAIGEFMRLYSDNSVFKSEEHKAQVATIYELVRAEGLISVPQRRIDSMLDRS